ncbi:MAG: hypothetical protein ABR583_09825 [Gaiellaceae bacterium]
MRPPLLLYLAWARNPARLAVAPTLAALAGRAGWDFELYYDELRAGRHFGGGPPEDARPGWPAGSLVAGGRHADHALRLAARFGVVALGDPENVLWPALKEARVEELVRSHEPAALYAAAFARLGEPLPGEVLVVDAAPQGENAIVAAPFLYPAFLTGPPVLGLEAGGEPLGERPHRGFYVAADRAPWLALRDGDAGGETYASFTATLAERWADWGRGVLLGDPELVAAQLPRARQLRLLPLYGRPQVDAIRAAAPTVRRAAEPVWGRQYDDRDFLELAELGHGLQVLDPDPPFDAGGDGRLPEVRAEEPADDDLHRWLAERRVLGTVLFWAGMVRETHCLPRIIDLVAATGLRAGVVLTLPAIRAADRSTLALLATPPDRGGVLGLLEPLLGSTGYGVAAEALLPDGRLASELAEAHAEAPSVRGWWPLLDTPLVPHAARRVERRGVRPVVRFTPRDEAPEAVAFTGAPSRSGRDLRALAGEAVRGLRLEGLFEEHRPFDDRRPGPLDGRIVAAVRGAGFEYMWTKASFGEARPALRENGFVALPFTAGNWDGWSPFYTVGSAADVARAERRLLRKREPGWLASTIDSPLFLLPGELLEHGSSLYELASLLAAGGRSGGLVNVQPNVVARYARLMRPDTTEPDQGLL